MAIVWKKPPKGMPRDLTKRDYRITISFVVQEATEQEALWRAETKRRLLKKGPRRRKRTWDEQLGRYTHVSLPVIEPVIESLEVVNGGA